MSHQRCESSHPHRDGVRCRRPRGHTRFHKNPQAGEVWEKTKRIENLVRTFDSDAGVWITSQRTTTKTYRSRMTFLWRRSVLGR